MHDTDHAVQQSHDGHDTDDNDRCVCMHAEVQPHLFIGVQVLPGASRCITAAAGLAGLGQGLVPRRTCTGGARPGGGGTLVLRACLAPARWCVACCTEWL